MITLFPRVVKAPDGRLMRLSWYVTGVMARIGGDSIYMRPVRRVWGPIFADAGPEERFDSLGGFTIP